MYNLISLTGRFSIDKLKKAVLGTEVLANQPRLEVHEIYADRNPEFSYREIHINPSLEYHVMDIGRVKDVPGTVILGGRIYSEEGVEKLMND